MDQADREKIKTHLISEIDKVKEDIISLKELSKPIEPDSAIGRLTRMEAICAKGISEAKLIDTKNKLIYLENALAKIADPDFGNCRECGDPIQIARLTLMPEAALCVECAQGE